MAVWMMFTAPCPTPSGKTAEQMVREREVGISSEMQASARDLGCTFYERWNIVDEVGEVTTQLVGDCGLVPLG